MTQRSVSADAPTMRVRLPPQLGGGDPAGLFQEWGLRLVAPPPADEPTLWTVSVMDDPVLTSTQLHGPPLSRSRFDVSTPPSPPTPGGAPADIRAAAFAELRENGTATGSLYAPLHAVTTRLITVPDAHLPAAIRTASNTLDEATFSDPQHRGAAIFPDHSVHDIRVHPVLYNWTKLPQILLRLQRQPIEEVIAAARAEPDRLTFQSAAALLDASIMGSPYYAPLLGNASPSMWGFGAPRINQTTLITFGRISAGLGGGPSRDALDLLAWLDTRTPSPTEPAPRTERERYDGLHRAAFAEAVEWWTQQMNATIRALYAPTTYVDADGIYLPAEHHRSMLNFEQLLSRVAAIGRSARDLEAQLILTFSAMDLIGDAFRSGGGGALFAPQQIERAIAPVGDRIPARPRPVIMLPTERALAAAHAISAEFFLPPRNTETSESKRIANLMTARRNATHGFHSNIDVLIEHSGHLPADVALIPYTYLLTFITQEGRAGLLQRISRSCARAGTAGRGG